MEVNYYETRWQDTVGYMTWHFDSLKRRGADPKSLIDIGAAHGDFIKMFETFWPDVEVYAFEANPLDAHYLKGNGWNVEYKCLGKPGTQTFYTNPNDPVGGGSSLYLENTEHFKDAVETEVEVVALDSLGITADFIKIDVQGAELDVLIGGEETVKQANYLLLELSFLNYNLDAPLIDDVLVKTRELGFRMIDTFGPAVGGHVWNDKKNQVDVLFVKDKPEMLLL